MVTERDPPWRDKIARDGAKRNRGIRLETDKDAEQSQILLTVTGRHGALPGSSVG